jgi:hypothetical protein
MFRDDKREGRGDEFMDDVRIYKGTLFLVLFCAASYAS